MKNAIDWVKILYTYGPFAILGFFVFVTERKSRTAMKEASDREKKALVGVYVLNWVVIFGLAIFSVYAWKQLNLDRKPTITGRLENLSDSETLVTSSADLYLHRIPFTKGEYADYEWLLVNKDKRFDDGAKIKFTIDHAGCNGGEANIFDYELPIQSDFYNNEVHLRRELDKLIWDHNGQETELSKRKAPRAAPAATPTARLEPPLSFLTTANAQTGRKPFSKDDFVGGLESPDAIVRRNARYELAKEGQSALPWIQDVLEDSKSSYRLRLGVIVALNNMPELDAKKLRPSTIKAINTAAADPDEALRDEAQSIRNKYGSIFSGDVSLPVTVYEHKNYSGRSQGFGPGRYRADKGEFGNLPNDSATSVRVAKGYRVRLCDNEGDGRGSGRCEEYGPGSHRLWSSLLRGVAKRVSYIEVTNKK